MKLRTWGRRPDPHKMAADKARRALITQTAIYGGSAGVFIMTLAAIATAR